MEFEYDPPKSEANRKKHGISLEDAAQLWEVTGVEIQARTEDELRFLRIGKIEGKFYSCIFTTRKAGAIRLISARRSRAEEENIYKENIEHESKRKED